MPDLTVLLPVYNGERYLRAAIQSVLAQSYRNFQLLIIDDASSDGSSQLAASFCDERIRLLRNERNLGLAGTLNRGLSLAETALIARHDQDDVSDPRRFERQVAHLQRYPELALLGTQARLIDHRGRRLGQLEVSCEAVSARWALLFDNSFIHPSVIFRREPILALGGYGQFRHSEDYDLWSRVAMRYPVANLPDCLITRRAHAQSMIGSLHGETAEQSKAENRAIIARTAQTLFEREFSELELCLLAQLRLGVDAEDSRSFLALYRELLRQYMQRNPEARQSRDFHRTTGRHFLQLARGVGRRSRLRATQALLLAARHSPGLFTTELAWRASAAALSGKHGRRLYERLGLAGAR